ncbi:MAG: MOSC domain-containing protein [Paracoccaceae bacterium]|nr:MOSC domain-containing protein [Paracoccaceae bacterium]MDG1738034.1 MOSC domain-containing protein [Paracoccaceae bacterium]MDG2258919.1 MOSC domain-containing protein [Paracoccaceae bacterium]
MPALVPTDYYATITWLGTVPADSDSIRSVARENLDLTFAGISGERHEGMTRPSCSRVLSQHPERDTEIANARQVSVMAAEEIAQIAETCGLDNLAPEFLGASVVIEGIGDFSHVPPSSRLQSENGTTLVVDMQNRPCLYPAREIEADLPGHGKPFKAAAKGLRGVTAWVERPGGLSIGDRLRLHVPDQRSWNIPPV